MGLKPATNPDVEATSIELSIDGKTVSAKDGVSLYDVISSTGKIIPAMCYHYTFDPFGSCGMCLVMQEGKKAPVRSCTAKATAGMDIPRKRSAPFCGQPFASWEKSCKGSCIAIKIVSSNHLLIFNTIRIDVIEVK